LRFDLAVAVGANQNTLLELSAVGRNRLGRVHAHGKRLEVPIDMVESERDDTTVVSANRAAATSLLDQKLLDALLATRDRLADASLATPSAFTLAAGIVCELGQTMTLAHPRLDRAFAVWIRRSSLLSN
jgi:hypothetical protein